MKKKILFITGTRADFGKITPLIRILRQDKCFDCHIFVTGMHMLKKHAYTFIEVQRSFPEALTLFKNQSENSQQSMDLILAETIKGLNECMSDYKPDLLIVHGDRVEALAGACVGSLNNILTAHIEGGEISGTIDELIRHSITKLAHVHFAANANAEKRLLQLGEEPSSIHVIGSPDIDLMLSGELPNLEVVRKHYDIEFKTFALFCYHPVTTNTVSLKKNMRDIVQALEASDDNYIVIDPNNDPGRDIIVEALNPLRKKEKYKFFPSINHLAYLTLLKHCSYLMGNSSSCVREAPIYATPSINLGSRQNKRYKHDTIIDVEEVKSSILSAISIQKLTKDHCPSFHFGSGGSAKKFLKYLNNSEFWNSKIQKVFRDVN
jgi:UDP-N-acetylglucosamine 2-epimerase (hydrolysing)